MVETARRLGFGLLVVLLGCRATPSATAAPTTALPETLEADVVETSGPEALETAIRFPPGWQGPCRGLADFGDGAATALYRYDHVGGCLVPLTIAVTGTYGCATKTRFDDSEHGTEYTYDDQGRMVSAGPIVFHWEGTRLAGTSRDGDRGRVTVIDSVMTDERSNQTIEVGPEGFPVAERSAGMLNRADLEYDQSWRLRRIVSSGGQHFTVQLDYCDEPVPE